MPVRLKLSNPLLGDDCYIGSVSNPINLHLTTTGNPPSEPIGEFPGAVFPAVPHSDAVFAAPGASGCGPLGALNWAVNLRGGVPAASGKNSLTTSSDVYAGGCTKGATACLTDERALERKTRADPWVGPRSTQSGQLTSGSRTVMVPSLTASAMLSCSFGHPSFNADDCPEAIASLKVWQRSAGSEVH